MELIDKSAVIAEIKKLRSKWDNPFCTTTCDAIEEGINNLEAKELYDTPVPTDNCRWHILNDKEAEKYHLRLIKIGEDKALLSINLAYIPRNMSIVTYLDWLRETGVILNFTPKTTHS